MNNDKDPSTKPFKPPNSKELLDTVIELLDEVSKDENIILKKDKYPLYEDKLYNDPKFDLISKKSYGLFRKIIDHEDISDFFEIIKKLEEFEKGNISNSKEASRKFESTLIDKYVKKDD